MTKKRNCFVTQVGDAIEALASALDPEREPPFKGDILDLLEWAERDVLEMRQQLEKFNDNREAAYRLHEEKCDQLRQQLAERDAELKCSNHIITDLHQHVTLLRDAIVAIWTSPNWKPDTMPRALIDQLQSAYKGEMK